ncbi:MAG: hypothetical protein ABI610_02785 [Acidobacteriota bacterium]
MARRCHLCQRHVAPTEATCTEAGLWFCRDAVACNYRARRRLGIPKVFCDLWRERDLELLSMPTRMPEEPG